MKTITLCKWFAKVSISILITFSLNGCMSINKVMDSWSNHHYSELIGSWGPPSQVYDDGNGGKIFIYASNRSYTTPGTSTTTTNGSGYGTATINDNYIWGNVNTNTQSKTTYNPSQTYQYAAYRMFYINKSSYIYKWSWKGL